MRVKQLDPYLTTYMKTLSMVERAELAKELGYNENYMSQLASRGTGSRDFAMKLLISEFNKRRPAKLQYRRKYFDEIYIDRRMALIEKQTREKFAAMEDQL